MVGAIEQELIKKNVLFQEVSIETIYFGGGSPSFISITNLKRILDTIREQYSVVKNLEITIECNPDDIDLSFATAIYSIGFNRISLGIQSFFDDDLQMMNRVHSSKEAKSAVDSLKEAGFENITIDLIYGLPNSDMKKWETNIDQALALGVPHISSYCLTIEDKTLLKHQIDKGIVKTIEDSEQLDQFKFLTKKLIEAGYEHYEISNFAKEGYRSKHNSSYWRNKDYIGVGPSAHSKIGNRRFWNISNNSEYIKRLKMYMEISEEEILSQKDQFNELIMIGLRTKEGVSISELKKYRFFDKNFQKELEILQNQDKISLKNEVITIEGENKFIADTIISDLFIV